MNQTVILQLLALVEKGEEFLPTLDARLKQGPLTGFLAPFEKYRAEAEHVVAFFIWIAPVVKTIAAL